ASIYAVETYYSRGTRGTRSDVVTHYDPRTLEPIGEIAIPPKRQAGVPMLSLTGLTDDQRFLVVYDFTPAQSVTVVDLTRKVSTPPAARLCTRAGRAASRCCAATAACRASTWRTTGVRPGARAAPPSSIRQRTRSPRKACAQATTGTSRRSTG